MSQSYDSPLNPGAPDGGRYTCGAKGDGVSPPSDDELAVNPAGNEDESEAMDELERKAGPNGVPCVHFGGVVEAFKLPLAIGSGWGLG